MKLQYPVRHFCCQELSQEEMEARFRDKTGFFSSAQPLIGPVRGETGIDGLRLDFNDGLRLEVPEGDFHVRISDADSEMVFFDDDVSAVRLQSMEKFYVHWQLDVYYGGGALAFSHVFDPMGQRVFFVDCSTALGDSLVVLPYLRAFRERYGAEVSCHLPEYLYGFAQRLLPGIEWRETWPEDCYATFYFGAAIDAPALSPEDGRAWPSVFRCAAATRVACLAGRGAADKRTLCLHRCAGIKSHEGMAVSRRLGHCRCGTSRSRLSCPLYRQGSRK